MIFRVTYDCPLAWAKHSTALPKSAFTQVPHDLLLPLEPIADPANQVALLSSSTLWLLWLMLCWLLEEALLQDLVTACVTVVCMPVGTVMPPSFVTISGVEIVKAHSSPLQRIGFALHTDTYRCHEFPCTSDGRVYDHGF